MLAALWYEVDHVGHTVIYKELYKGGLIVSEAANALLEQNAGDQISAWYAPPDLWNRNRDTDKSTAEVFLSLKIPLVQTSNERGQGSLEIKEYLKPVELKNEQTGEVKYGARLQVYEGAAPNLVRCIKKIQRDEKKPNEYATEPHELTHIVDALRAYCAGRPLSTPVQTKEETDAPAYETQVDEFLQYGY
jgi:phage terminase large subunit